MSSETPRTLVETGIRFENTKSALTVVVPHPFHSDQFAWTCMGCREVSSGHSLDYTRKHAREHSESCVALPPADGSQLVPFKIGLSEYQVEGGRA